MKESFESELYLAERVHGGALAWERRMDAAALKCVARLPGGPPSSYVLLDSLMGRDGKLELEEALNLPEHRPVGPKKSPTELFEQQARW